jgi:DNA-binding beta-propeller fold protein YncE
MLVAQDEKVTWDRQGRIHFLPPGKDSVSIFDIGTDAAHPVEVACLPLANSLFGPPTNLAITPDGALALVANSMAWHAQGTDWVPAPGQTLHVIDLTQRPCALAATLEVGRQPSGLAISRDGTLALVVNRADASVSVLAIEGGEVRVIDTVAVAGGPVGVAFSADGRRAFVAKMDAHRLAVLHIDGRRVTHDPADDILTGLVPYNVAVTPDGKLALTVDMGHPNASDGHVDTISVIDVEAAPPRITDKIVVGDAPEGLVISPTGAHAAAIVVQGSNCDHASWVFHPRGKVVLLKIADKQVTRVSEIEVGALPEGAVFSPDGRYLYVGNFLDADLSVLQVVGDELVDTGTRIALRGHPAAMRTQSL